LNPGPPQGKPRRAGHQGSKMPVGTMYRVRVLSKLRAGFPPNSKDLGSVPVGTVLKAIEQRTTATGIDRVRFSNVSAKGVLQGWVSLKASGALP
jgi:hypothetical protein